MIESLEVLSSATSFREEDLRGKTAVMIDVLRASSTIVTALHNGAEGVIPVADTEDASEMARNMTSDDYLLCGENGGVKIEGFDLGNSPLEYGADTVAGKTVILNTTNGTRALSRSSLADTVLVGSFLNLASLAEELHRHPHIVLVCAGWRGRMSLEDLLCAGNIIYELTDGELPPSALDGAKVAFGLFEKFGDDIERTIQTSSHAERLKGIVGEDDLAYCCRKNETRVLPVLNEGILTDFHGKN